MRSESTTAKTKRSLLVTVATVVVYAGCRVSPTGPDTMSPPATSVFTGTVYPQGHTQWRFKLAAPGTVSLTLTSIDGSIAVGLGLGETTEHACELIAETVTSAGSQPQIATVVEAGDKCVQVFDAAGVPEDGASFSVSIRTF